MSSDVPCARTARLELAVGFPMAPLCSLALSGGSTGMAETPLGCCSSAERCSNGLGLKQFLLSNPTEHSIGVTLCRDVCCLLALRNGDPGSK